MKLTRKCQLDGREYTLDIPRLTPELLSEGLTRWENGEHIQHVFNYLEAEEWEFLMTGTPPEVWDKIFGPENDADD